MRKFFKIVCNEIILRKKMAFTPVEQVLKIENVLFNCVFFIIKYKLSGNIVLNILYGILQTVQERAKLKT